MIRKITVALIIFFVCALSTVTVSSDSQGINTTWDVKTFNTFMNTGSYNLVAYYGVANSTAEQFGQDISNVEYVARYNTNNNTFTTHVMGSGGNNFTTTHGRGYFVYMNSSGSTTYTRCNISASPYDTSLLTGWNIIGWTNASNTNAEGLITSIGSACKYTSMLNADGITYTTHTSGFTSSNHVVEKGEGYWIWVNTNMIWGRNS